MFPNTGQTQMFRLLAPIYLFVKLNNVLFWRLVVPFLPQLLSMFETIKKLNRLMLVASKMLIFNERMTNASRLEECGNERRSYFAS